MNNELSAQVEAVDFAEWLAEHTQIMREPKITLYRYCDNYNEWGNYTLADIYTVFKEKYEPESAAGSQVSGDKELCDIASKISLDAALSQVSAEGYTVYWFNDEQFVPEWQVRQLQQRVAHLRELLAHKTAMVEHLDQIASDAWRAAVAWEHWHYYEEIYGKLMPKDMRNNRPPQLHEYLSRFEQTKTAI